MLLNVNVKAANFKDNQTVDTNKTWTIKFTNNVKFEELIKNSLSFAKSMV
ncbi:hypothetical protein JMF89_00980 [Clostridiaceae bacterium UIB06]|nr:hypothetical protein [Clostridiaceae bacterium UIB06]